VTSIAAESKFVELVRGWLVSLPHDLKIAFDAMDDENLPRPVREVAAGVIAYVVSPNDGVSDRHDAVASYADDVVLLRIALQKALGPGQDEQSFRDRFPELFEGGLVFRTDYPVDEKTITDKLKKATTITDVMRRRQAEEARAKGVKARA
jgi:uncharacterized membrane protein YkvA (DUF1232 family)